MTARCEKCGRVSTDWVQFSQELGADVCWNCQQDAIADANAEAQTAEREHLAAEKDEFVEEVEVATAQSLDACLSRAQSFLRRFVVLTDDQACAIALWVAHTYVVEAAVVTPYLWISSPEKRSGKTRLLEVLRLIVANPWLTGGTTKAALVRKVDKDSPTLLLDESDAAFNADLEYSEALRGVLDNGFSRGKPYTTCIGNSHAVHDFNVFGPKAIAGLGRLPDTVRDRSIPIKLKRRTRSEKVDRFRERKVRSSGETIAAGLGAAVEPLVEELEHAEPELPAELSDRGWDIWEPLLAIADAAGEGWPKRARQVARMLSGEQDPDEETLGVRLLGDIREVMEEEQLPTQELRGRLRELEEAPWGGWNDGEGIRARELANKLRPYGIRSHDLRTDEGTKKGYRRADFEDAWERYFPPSPDSKRDKRDIGSIEPRTAPSQARQSPPMSRIEDGRKPHGNADVADVADRSPEKRETASRHPEIWDRFIEGEDS
jgi:Protein of unknown function (DUF3631)